MTDANSAVLRLQEIRKDYGGPIPAIGGVSLSVERGRVVCLLGPSGCGKTTTLRAIAGFVALTSGRILMEGVDITRTPAHQRNVGLVFQNYALFPHLSVAENVAFGLRSVRAPARERNSRVDELLGIVQLGDYRDRLPRELSGGQQQRVAFARALALRPSVLLLDEPFSNLDAQLRRHMREEVRALIDRLGITTIFVTHDQEEALAIADRIVVMNQGLVEQEGDPHTIYEKPRTKFVAEFIGRCTVIQGEIGEDGYTFRIGENVDLVLPAPRRPGPAVGIVRPEHLMVVPEKAGTAAGCRQALRGRVARIVYQGPSSYVYVIVGGLEWLVESASEMVVGIQPDDQVLVTVRPEHIQVLED